MIPLLTDNIYVNGGGAQCAFLCREMDLHVSARQGGRLLEGKDPPTQEGLEQDE